MQRLRLPTLLLSILLVLAMPLEQGRCMCGTPAPLAHHARTAAVHCHAACCAAAAGRAAHAHGRAPENTQGCGCVAYSAGVLPAVPSPAGPDRSLVAFLLLPSLGSVEPVAESRAHSPVLDVGSPPLPVTPGAHGLRAPPALA